jgi:hypothetical protein
MKMLYFFSAILFSMPAWSQNSETMLNPKNYWQLRTDLLGPLIPNNRQFELGLEHSIGKKHKQGLVVTTGYSETRSFDGSTMAHIDINQRLQKKYVGLEIRQYFHAEKGNSGAFLGAGFQRYSIQVYQQYTDVVAIPNQVIFDTTSVYQQNAYQLRFGYSFSDRKNKWLLEPSASIGLGKGISGESYSWLEKKNVMQISRCRISIIRRF